MGSGEHKLVSTWFGERINSLNEEIFKPAITLAVAEICLLNGLETYDSEHQNAMYVAQMKIIGKFIFEGFGYLTPAEITNAFHLNLQGKYGEVYKQYGKKEINCEFIGQVLSAYRDYKQDFVNLNPDLLKIINPPEELKQIEYRPDIPNEERVMIEKEYQKFLIDPEWNCGLLMNCVYTRLEEDELIPKEFYKKFIKKAQGQLLRESQLKKLMPTSKERVKTNMEDGSIGYIIQKNFDMNKQINQESHQIRNGSSSKVDHFAMQLSVVFYFKNCVNRGLKNIYVKE